MLAKKAKCWKTAINASNGAKHRFPIEGKKFFPADALRAFANTHKNAKLERIVNVTMSPVGVEPTTYCLGEMLTASLPENCTAL